MYLEQRCLGTWVVGTLQHENCEASEVSYCLFVCLFVFSFVCLFVCFTSIVCLVAVIVFLFVCCNFSFVLLLQC